MNKWHAHVTKMAKNMNMALFGGGPGPGPLAPPKSGPGKTYQSHFETRAANFWDLVPSDQSPF